MYMLVTVLVVVAYGVRSESLCKLENAARVQYCFDPGYNNGLRRCNTFEPEGVIVRPGCGGSRPYSNQTLAPRRCIDGNWEDIFTCSTDIRRKTGGCKLQSHPSVKHTCLDVDNAPRLCNALEPHGAVIRPECNSPDFYTPSPLPLMKCVNGHWDTTVTCLPDIRRKTRGCKLKSHPSVKHTCLDVDNAPRLCNALEPHGAVIRPECNSPDFYSPSPLPLMQCVNGHWNTTVTCSPKSCDTPEKRKAIVNGLGCGVYQDPCCLLTERRSTTKPIIRNKPKKKKREGCGWRNPDGVGSQIGGLHGDAKLGEFPWVCAIFRNALVNLKKPEGEKVLVYVSGGSLIHPSVVLTAAQHVDRLRELRARAGDWDIRTTKEIYAHQDRDVISTLVHERFDRSNLFFDIAVLLLSKPMDSAPNVGVACLPLPKEKTPDETRCFALGWGIEVFKKKGNNTILKKTEVAAVEHEICEAWLRMETLGSNLTLHPNFMCAGEEEVDSCQDQDVGAPLSCAIASEKDRFMQSGVVVWGVGCPKPGLPGAYVDVANLRDWIDEKVMGKGYDPAVYTYKNT